MIYWRSCHLNSYLLSELICREKRILSHTFHPLTIAYSSFDREVEVAVQQTICIQVYWYQTLKEKRYLQPKWCLPLFNIESLEESLYSCHMPSYRAMIMRTNIYFPFFTQLYIHTDLEGLIVKQERKRFQWRPIRVICLIYARSLPNSLLISFCHIQCTP